MDGLFKVASDLAGVPPDNLKLIFCLLVAYPLGSLYVRVPYTSANLRHVFSIATSLFFLLIVFHMNIGVLQLVAESLFTYGIAYSVKSKQMPWIVFAATMGHLTINHVIRAIEGVSYETMEITGSQMVLTMKLTTFAWNVYDGRRPAAELDASQLATRITEFPSLLAFLGYVFYFPGILVGPSVEYTYYDQLVTGKLFDSVKKEDGSKKRVPEGRKRVAYTKFALGLFFLGFFAVFGGKYDYDRIMEPEFLQRNFASRFLLTQMLGFSQRTKYYGVWLLTEGASILTGLGFNGYTPSGQTKWDRTANVDISNIELAPNFKILLDSWNMNTNVWLRNCVYKRVTPKGKKPGLSSTMLTFGTSAFWHGIHPGYYMSFFFGGFIQYANRLARQYWRPFFVGDRTTQRIYDIAGILVSSALLNYAVVPFQLLDLKRSLLAWTRLGWYGHVMIAGTIIFFLNGGKGLVRNLADKMNVTIAGGKPKEGAVPAVNGMKSGLATPGTATPGVLGAPNGFSLTVPPVEQGIKEAQNALSDEKKTK